MCLIRRTVGISLILLVICAGTIVVVRANRGPDRLQAMGFGLCDGEPCWRGLKPGTDWQKTQHLIPEATESRSPITVTFDGIDEYVTILVYSSRDKKTVSSIILEADLASSAPTVADLLQFLGYPCAVQPIPDPGVEINRINLIYAQVRTLIFQANSRLGLDSPIRSLTLEKPRASKPCAIFYNDLSPWYGFTSANVYLARYQRAVGTAR